jgi:heptosyltransferase III
MKHQYKTEIFWKRIAQTILDFFVDVFVKIFINNKKPNNYSDPDKILFIILAQLGDSLVMSYVFPIIRERFPNSSIDVLCGEWSKPILENNPYVNNLIFFNHLRMNRSQVSIWKKIINHLKTSHSALKYIRLQKFDLSIEGGVTHPNGNIMSYRGGVKRRIGFGSGGFGGLLTDEVRFPNRSSYHILEAVLDELRLIGVNNNLNDLIPYFSTSSSHAIKKQNLFSAIPKPFIIIQPESGNINRMMENEFWLEITQIILKMSNYFIVICGTSELSSNLLKFLLFMLEDKSRIIDKVQKLSLDEFFLLCDEAKCAITLESLPAHLCSINCKTLSFYKNGSGVYFFPIPGKHSTVIHNHFNSKEPKLLPKVRSYYIKDFKSRDTFELVSNFLVEL